MNLVRFIIAGLFLASVSGEYGMQASGLKQEFIDTKTNNHVVIQEIKLDSVKDVWWEAAQEFTILSHRRDPEKDCEANTKLKASFAQLQYRFEHAGEQGVDIKNFPLPESKQNCFFSIIYAGNTIIGIGIAELVGQRVTSCYTLANFEEYDAVIMLSEFIKILKTKFPESTSFVKSAPKSIESFHTLLAYLGFNQVADELDHCIRGDRREDSLVFELEF